MKRTSGVFFLFLLGVSCGKRGDPLLPLRLVPSVVEGLSARRVGDRLELHFTLPSANQDGSKPIALERVDVYARSVAEGSPPPSNDQIIDKQNLVGTVSVHPPESDKPPKSGTEPPKDDRPAAGDIAAFVDRIPSGTPAPLPPPRRAPAPVRAPLPVDPSLPVPPPAPPVPPTRYVMLVAVSPKGHAGRPLPIAVPLTRPPAAPRDLRLASDETTLTVTWVPGIEGQRFRVYDVDASGREIGAGPLTPAPLESATFTLPTEFGKERCVAVRGVEIRGNIAIETDAVTACVAPVDTFPPPVPANLDAFADTGFITLTWDPVKAQDLGGYLVLRREGSSDRLQQLTPEPITQTAYKDSAVRPGATYEYAVVAVDQSTPANKSATSAIKTVTAR